MAKGWIKKATVKSMTKRAPEPVEDKSARTLFGARHKPVTRNKPSSLFRKG